MCVTSNSSSRDDLPEHTETYTHKFLPAWVVFTFKDVVLVADQTSTSVTMDSESIYIPRSLIPKTVIICTCRNHRKDTTAFRQG